MTNKKPLKESNKIAVFLAEIPDIYYRVSYGAGYLIVLLSIIKISKNSNFSILNLNFWLILADLFGFLITGGLVSVAILVVIGLIRKAIISKK